MDIRVLRYFLAAAEQQSISGAAQKLHVTQPTLSRQFMELEEELGHTLFVRSNRKLRLTSKGELFYERARSIVNLFDRTKEEIRAEDELTGDIRIACGRNACSGKPCASHSPSAKRSAQSSVSHRERRRSSG